MKMKKKSKVNKKVKGMSHPSFKKDYKSPKSSKRSTGFKDPRK